ncbi:MAG: sigma-70 family RNA polymerase sigma factor [Ilumatobacteraceae bacterium]
MAIKSVLGGDYSLGERTDEELIDLARAGGSRTGAWDELYRRHAGVARSVARHLLHTRHDADDVVNESFAGVIAAIGHGAGPRENFRQYLMACVRNGCKKRSWRANVSISTDPAVLEHRHGAVFEDAEQFGEAGLVASAFSSLSVDWQRALWMTAVEERPTAEIARELGRRPAAVAALAHRAREAFAEAYLAQHQQRVTLPACERITPKLAQYVRGRAGDSDTARVDHHLSNCSDCTRAVAELRDVNSSLRTLALPTTLAGAGVIAATVGPAVGLEAAVTIGGWSSAILGGFTLAKVAMIAALLVPAVVIAAESTHNDDRTIAASATGDPATGVGPQELAAGDAGSNNAVPTTAGELLADVALSTTTTVVVPSTVPATTAVVAVDVAQTPTEGAVEPVVSVVSGAVPPTTARATISLPGVTVLPSITTPSVVLLPPITTAEISTPTVSIPSISLPLVTPPPIAIPPVVVPPVQISPVVVPSVSTTVVAIPPVTVLVLSVPLTVADLPLPSFPLPLPKLPDLLGK